MNEPFSPEFLAEATARAKVALRKRMRAVRSSYPQAALVERNRKLVQRALEIPELQQARGVALFWPLLERKEVDLRELDGALRVRGVRVFYPFQDPTDRGTWRTGFRESVKPGDVQVRGQRFAEPPPDTPEAQRGDVDFVFVPALAVDASGHRIGYGAGYYDATLADVCPPARSIVVAYDFQFLAEIPFEAHDVPCDWVLSDERFLNEEEKKRFSPVR